MQFTEYSQYSSPNSIENREEYGSPPAYPSGDSPDPPTNLPPDFENFPSNAQQNTQELTNTDQS